MSWLCEALIPLVPHDDLPRVACVSTEWAARVTRAWGERFPWRTRVPAASIFRYLRQAHALPHRLCLACGDVLGACSEDVLKVACPCTKRMCRIMLQYHARCAPPRLLRPHCSVVMVRCPLCRESCLALTD